MRGLALIAAVTAALAFASTALAAAPDGSGTLDYLGDPVPNGSSGNLLDFNFTLASGEQFVDGALRITVPTGWSPPSTTPTDAGYTTSNCGTVDTSGQRITITGITLDSASCDITYGDVFGGGPGVTAPTTPGPVTFNAATRATAGGTFTPIASSPAVDVLAPDGSGTMTTPTQAVPNGSTGNTVTFTYTAATGGVFGGLVILKVPPGWSAPSDDPAARGFVSTTGGFGFPFILDQQIAVFPVILDAGESFDITYGDRTGGGRGATAPTTTGRQRWTTLQQSACGCGDVIRLASSPMIRVLPPDGGGKMVVDPTGVIASSRTTLRFKYRPGAGGMSGGAVSIHVPEGWSAPSTDPAAPGYVTASAGTVSVSGRTVIVSGLTVFGTHVGIVYGARAGGGPGALVPAPVGTATFAAAASSSTTGTLTPLAVSPTVTVS